VYRTRSHRLGTLLAIAALGASVPQVVRADEVLDWNAVLERTLLASTPTVPAKPVPAHPRQAAIVNVAMFDAYNGIERRFTPIHVNEFAPRGASRRAAVVYAAYTALVGLYPEHTDALNADLAASLAGIAAGPAHEHSQSIARGRAWGEYVAQQILAWRASDGLDFSPSSYVGSLDVGKWRPTPRPNPTPGEPELPGVNGLLPSLATTAPFSVPSPSHFRPAGPPPLASAQYAADVNEVKEIGENVSATRTTDQTEAARFWGGTALTFWLRTAAEASRERHLTLSENARLFAVLSMAVADTVITTWDSKYWFELWRPITAIRLASTDDNPATEEQADWTPLLVTPPYPEYLSGAESLAGATAAVLTAYFGSAMPFEGFSEGLPGVTRSWPSFEAAAEEVLEARIWAGIHFRAAMVDTLAVAKQIATYVLRNEAQPLHGKKKGQLKKPPKQKKHKKHKK
jgi:hypothetical protein